MKKITMVSAGAAAILALVITFGSPYIALHQIRNAIAERDAEALSDHVDFPALRENIKGQIMGGMMAAMDAPKMKSNPFAGMGQAIGAAMIGPMIDTLVSPAGIIALMQRATTSNSDINAGPSTMASTLGENAGYAVSFKGWDKVILHRADMTSREGALTLRRYGLWDWKITSIDMPPSAFK